MMSSVPWDPAVPSRTPGLLRRLRLLTVAAIVVVGLGAGGVVYGAHATVGSVADGTAPATTAVQVARASLAEANRAVVESFRSGTARLAGPGQRYQDGITRANHSLAQLAEYYAGDVAATQQLQFVNAMLVTYMGLVAQADTAHRLAGATGAGYDLGLIYLWHASKLLFDPAGGILALVDALGEPVADELAGQASSWWLRPVALVPVLFPGALLLGLLVGVQLFLTHRFRRVANPPLAIATIGLLVLTAWTMLVTVDTNRDYRAALDAHAELTGGWRTQAQVAGVAAQAGLTELLTAPCAGEGGCETAVSGALTAAALADAAPDAGAEATPPAPAPDHAPREDEAQIRYHATSEAAAATSGLRAGIPVLAVVIAGLALVGFKPRLDEFRD